MQHDSVPVESNSRKYYEAYDDRYRQVHYFGLKWFTEAPTPILLDVIGRYSVLKDHRILEIGCGEGRDAFYLLEQGYHLVASDISQAAIAFCTEHGQAYQSNFRVLDCIRDQLEESFDFIYAVAVLHMLVEDEDRKAFYNFIRNHLSPGGIAMVCTMGDGEQQFHSDISQAFQLHERVHEQSGIILSIARTSCRVVNRETFIEEIRNCGFKILEQGDTSIEPDFTAMLYAVICI